MSILRRLAAGSVTLALAATGAVALAPPAGANGDALWFDEIGEPTGVYGPNAAVRIWGDLTTKNLDCAEDGVNDFVYPTSDVYIVVPGTAVGNLVDVTGKPPNTVVQYGSVFDDEVIGITTPAGHLQGGTYDVVFDTCQDGRFDHGEDALFPGVLTVEIPGDLPAPDGTLVDLKAAAYEEYESWKQTRRVVDGVWKLLDKALKDGCKAGNPTACALKHGNYFNPIQEQFSGLLLNQGQHYLGIYEDPPQPAFEAPVQVPAVADDGDAIAAEGAVAGALLDAVEAYKGAQVAGDRTWALVHARTARDLHTALEQSLAGTTAQLQALRALYDDQADAALEYAFSLQNRLIGSGFEIAERRTLRENGLTDEAIVALEAGIRASRAPAVRASTVRDSIDRLLDAHTGTATAAQQGAAGWQDIVATLEGDPATPDEHPTVTVGGPFDAVEGAPTTLSATGSAGSVLAWDVDGDRDFDDASGSAPAATFAHDGATVVGVRATDAGGRSTYGWSSVRVTRSGEGPQVGEASPADDLVRVTTGDVASFAVTPTDDTGAPTTTWTVDGDPAGTGDTLDWTAPDEPGTRIVVATVTDADGHTASHQWQLLVHREDADGDGWTATTDCDDEVAIVHPGRTEVLGTGVDEDCDAATPDAPVGGITGSVSGWGFGSFGLPGAGPSDGNVIAPQPTVLPGDVRQVDAGDRASYAVLADRTVVSWGLDLFGSLGRGGVPSRPGPVVHADGGLLGGVLEVAAGHNHVLARRSDGTVVAWGDQRTGQLGDGSDVDARSVPRPVLTGPGAALTDVVDVEAGTTSSYALRADGSVWAWGAVGCDGATNDGRDRYAAPIEGLTGVRSISVTDSIVLFVLEDGRLLSCGAADALLARPTGPAASPYSPLPVVGLGDGRVVDASQYGAAVVVLLEDGSVRMWGRNTNGALSVLGVVKDAPVSTPTEVPLPAGPPVVDVDNEGAPVTFATRADGSVLAWGGNLYGHAGLGLPGGEVSTPTVVSFPGRVVIGMAVGTRNAYALTRPVEDPALELPLSWVSASAADATVGESTGGAVTVTLSDAVRSDVSLTWELRSAEDEPITGGTAVVPAGATSVDVPVAPGDDALDEDDAALTFAVTDSSLGVGLARPQSTVVVTDDDAPPTVQVAPVSVEEGSTTLTDAKVRFTLSAPSGKEVIAHYATGDGTATAGQDYVATTATLRFAPGETADDVHLAVLGDVAAEGEEAFSVSLGEVTNGAAGQPAAVTISDHDPVTVSVTAPQVAEGDTGTTPATFTVELSPAVPGLQVEVPWTVVEPAFGDGDLAGDVAAGTGSVSLTGSAPTAPVTVQVTGDELPEPAEAFTLGVGTLTASDGRPVLVQRVGTAWVLDDDPAAAPAWPFDGFFSPVANEPAVNTVKAGSAVPLKFSLGGDRGLDVLADGFPASATAACGADAIGPLQPIVTADGSALTYDAGSGRYKIVWKTDKAWAGTCRQLVLTLADGSTHTASFRLK